MWLGHLSSVFSRPLLGRLLSVSGRPRFGRLSPVVRAYFGLLDPAVTVSLARKTKEKWKNDGPEESSESQRQVARGMNRTVTTGRAKGDTHPTVSVVVEDVCVTRVRVEGSASKEGRGGREEGRGHPPHRFRCFGGREGDGENSGSERGEGTRVEIVDLEG